MFGGVQVNLKNMKRQTNKGFTLIELLVVIAIIGVLASVVLVSLNSSRMKSRNARRVADIRQIMTALELFYNDNYRYPSATSGVPTAADGSPAWNTFMKTWPLNPTPQNDGSCSAAEYAYTQTGSGTGYVITFCLGAQTGGYSAGSHTLTPAGIQ